MNMLPQFARVNGGTSPQDYAAAHRVNLLNSLSAIVDWVVERLDDTHPGQKSAIERIVSLAVEEMTRHADVIPTIQVIRSNLEFTQDIGRLHNFLIFLALPPRGTSCT